MSGEAERRALVVFDRLDHRGLIPPTLTSEQRVAVVAELRDALLAYGRHLTAVAVVAVREGMAFANVGPLTITMRPGNPLTGT